MHTEFRRATPLDLAAIQHLIEEGRRHLAEQGIPQWQDGYPDAQTLTGDIERGNAFVLVANGRLVATAALVFGREPDYDPLHGGHWAGPDDRYTTLHRLAVCDAARGKGVAAQMMHQLTGVCKGAGMAAIRVDTHRKNLGMRHFLKKQGFEYRGVIYLKRDGAERLAYERLLTE